MRGISREVLARDAAWSLADGNCKDLTVEWAGWEATYAAAATTSAGEKTSFGTRGLMASSAALAVFSRPAMPASPARVRSHKGSPKSSHSARRRGFPAGSGGTGEVARGGTSVSMPSGPAIRP